MRVGTNGRQVRNDQTRMVGAVSQKPAPRRLRIASRTRTLNSRGPVSEKPPLLFRHPLINEAIRECHSTSVEGFEDRPGGFKGAVYDAGIVRAACEAGLELGRRKIDAAFEHAPEELGVAFRV